MAGRHAPMSGVAGGDIRTSRFIKLDASNNRKFLEADAADHPVIGASTEALRAPIIPEAAGGPTTAETRAAKDGDQFEYYPLPSGDVPVEAGTGGVTRNDYGTPDADGKVVTATSGQRACCIVWESAAAGELARVELISPFTVP